MDDTVPFELLAEGHFASGQLAIRWRDEPRPTTPELERMISAEWERRRADADRKGQILFNGQLARYLAHETRDGCLTLIVGPTDYRDFVGTNLYNNRRLAEFGRERFANPIGTTGMLIGRDGFLVLGRRGRRVAYHGGYLHTIGGGLEQDERRQDGTIDGFASLLRELNEELGITENEVMAIECVGLARDDEIHQPELLFEARIDLDREMLARRVDPSDPQQEHTELEFCLDRPEAIVEFLGAARPVAPVATAALLLHGKLAWGPEWFESACEGLQARNSWGGTGREGADGRP